MDGIRIKGEVRVDSGAISLTVQCGPENGGQSLRRDPWSRLGIKEHPQSEAKEPLRNAKQGTKKRGGKRQNKNQRKLKGKTKQIAESLKRKKGHGQSQAVRKSSHKQMKLKAAEKMDQSVLMTADVGWTPTVFAGCEKVGRPESAEYPSVPDRFVRECTHFKPELCEHFYANRCPKKANNGKVCDFSHRFGTDFKIFCPEYILGKNCVQPKNCQKPHLNFQAAQDEYMKNLEHLKKTCKNEPCISKRKEWLKQIADENSPGRETPQSDLWSRLGQKEEPEGDKDWEEAAEERRAAWLEPENEDDEVPFCRGPFRSGHC